MDVIVVTEPKADKPYSTQGELVRQAREAMPTRLSQEGLGRLAHLSSSMIYKIESGGERPSAEAAHAIDGVLGTENRIFRAYYPELKDDDVMTLRAQLAQLSLDVRSLEATVSRLLDEQEPPPGDLSR